MGNLILPVGWVLFCNGQLLGKHEVDGCVLTHKIPDKRVSDGHTTLVLSKEGQKVGLEEEVLLLSQAWKLGAALLKQECMFTSVTVMMHSAKGRSSGYNEPHAHIILTKGRFGKIAFYFGLWLHSLPAVVPKQMFAPLVDVVRRFLVIFN